MTIRVAIPCRRFAVRAHLGYAEGLSQLEQFALRAVAARSATAVELASTLGLDPRMALDLCVDLVKAGLAELDMESGRLTPTELVRDRMGDPAKPSSGWAEALASERAPESEEVDLFQDLVSGAVFPALSTSRGSDSLIAPEWPEVPSIENIEHTVLAGAAARAIETRRRRIARKAGGSGQEEYPVGLKVVDVSLATPLTIQGASEANAWRERVRVELEAKLDERGDIADLNIVEPSSISFAVRRSVARGLLELLVRGLRDEEGQFFHLLRERARNAAAPVDDDERAHEWDPPRRLIEIEHTLSEVNKIPNAPLSLLAERHIQLAVQWERAREETLEASARKANAELVCGTAAHQDLVLDALRTARDQVVLMCPWFGQLEGNRTLRDALTDAVARGVRIHLVWGIDGDARRDHWPREVETLCGALNPQGSGTGGLFASDWGAGVHAKLVAKDFDWMLVSSCNFLNAPSQRTAIELGVKVSQQSDSAEHINRVDGATSVPRMSGPLPATLLWARSVVPDFLVRRTMVVDPVLGGAAFLPPPVELERDIRAPDTDLARKFWPGWWSQRIGGLHRYLKALGTYVVPVFDIGHRSLLFEALESAQERVVVSSDKLGVGLLGHVPAAAVEAARARGVEITVVYAEEVAGTEFQARRADLQRQGVRFLQRGVHAKTLVSDDRVCVSSFNFLSFEGIGRGGNHRRELGVRVFQAGFADRVVQELLGSG